MSFCPLCFYECHSFSMILSHTFCREANITNVRASVRLKCFWGNEIISASIEDKCFIFLVKVSLTNKHLFYNYFVRLSIDNSITNNGRNYSCLLFKCDIYSGQYVLIKIVVLLILILWSTLMDSRGFNLTTCNNINNLYNYINLIIYFAEISGTFPQIFF